MNPPAPLTPEDPQWLAFALGEITDESELRRIEAALESDPGLRAEVEAGRRLARELRAALAAEPAPQVDAQSVISAAMAVTPPDRSRRRRAQGLGGALSGGRGGILTFPSRALACGGAVAACLAAFIAVSTPEAEPDLPRVSASVQKDRNSELILHTNHPVQDSAGLAARLPGLPGSGSNFRPCGRASLALTSAGSRAYAAAFTRELQSGGARPVATGPRLDGLVNAFLDSGQRAPAGAKTVLIETALTDAPWNREHRILRVTLRIHGAKDAVVAKSASAFVDFNKAGVRSWRILGHEGAQAPSLVANLRAGETVTTLYEIDPLTAATETVIAQVSVRYARADKSGSEEVSASVSGSDRKLLSDSDPDTRFAAGLAAYALNLGESPNENLALFAGENPDRCEFAKLVAVPVSGVGESRF